LVISLRGKCSELNYLTSGRPGVKANDRARIVVRVKDTIWD